MRSKAYNHDMTWRKALRKKRIAEEIYGGYYDNLHQYSKNKIHCSCPLCSAKTKRGSKISDLRKIQSLEYIDED
jgi:hypothetical protein